MPASHDPDLTQTLPLHLRVFGFLALSSLRDSKKMCSRRFSFRCQGYLLLRRLIPIDQGRQLDLHNLRLPRWLNLRPKPRRSFSCSSKRGSSIRADPRLPFPFLNIHSHRSTFSPSLRRVTFDASDAKHCGSSPVRSSSSPSPRATQPCTNSRARSASSVARHLR